jgi:hypothetical protein
LPYLKVGYLTAPPADDPIAPHKLWERSQFILNHEELQQVFVFTYDTQPTFLSVFIMSQLGFILLDTDSVITNLGQHL